MLEPKSADSILGYSLVFIPFFCGVFTEYFQFIPYDFNLSLIGDLLVLSPFFHYYNLVRWVLELSNNGQIYLHALWLLWATLFFGGVALWSYQRETIVQR